MIFHGNLTVLHLFPRLFVCLFVCLFVLLFRFTFVCAGVRSGDQLS